MIQAEGVESLSEAELREDCRERGMLGLLSVEEMRQQVFFLLFFLMDSKPRVGSVNVPSRLLSLSGRRQLQHRGFPSEATFEDLIIHKKKKTTPTNK